MLHRISLILILFTFAGGLKAILTDQNKLVVAVGGVTALAAGIYTTRYLSNAKKFCETGFVYLYENISFIAYMLSFQLCKMFICHFEMKISRLQFIYIYILDLNSFKSS